MRETLLDLTRSQMRSGASSTNEARASSGILDCSRRSLSLLHLRVGTRRSLKFGRFGQGEGARPPESRAVKGGNICICSESHTYNIPTKPHPSLQDRSARHSRPECRRHTLSHTNHRSRSGSVASPCPATPLSSSSPCQVEYHVEYHTGISGKPASDSAGTPAGKAKTLDMKDNARGPGLSPTSLYGHKQYGRLDRRNRAE